MFPTTDDLNCDMNWNIQLDPLGIARVRQAALLPELQGQNIGNQLMAQCEAYAKENHHFHSILTARKMACLFYLKRDYQMIFLSFRKHAVDFLWITKHLP